MQPTHHFKFLLELVVLAALPVISSPAFEGYIHATAGSGGAPQPLVYTVGTNAMRIELVDTNAPNTVDLVDRKTGAVTLVYPHNHTLMRLTSSATEASDVPPGMPIPPGGLPPGIGPNAGHAPGIPATPNNSPMPTAPPMPPGGLPPGIGPTNFPGPPGFQRPQMPQMPPRPQTPATPANGGMGAMPTPPMMGGKLELQATGGMTNILGYDCRGYEIQQREETMTVWATDQLPFFQMYLPAEPHAFGPPMMEEQWGKLFTEKKLFPLLATLRMPNGMERYRFEVQSIVPATLTTNDYRRLQLPTDYIELQPHSF